MNWPAAMRWYMARHGAPSDQATADEFDCGKQSVWRWREGRVKVPQRVREAITHAMWGYICGERKDTGDERDVTRRGLERTTPLVKLFEERK